MLQRQRSGSRPTHQPLSSVPASVRQVSCDELLQYVLNFDANAAEQGADLERGGSGKGGAT